MWVSVHEGSSVSVINLHLYKTVVNICVQIKVQSGNNLQHLCKCTVQRD